MEINPMLKDKTTNEEKLLRFTKDYKEFKKGMYLAIPRTRFTGQTNIGCIWNEVETLLEAGILKEV